MKAFLIKIKALPGKMKSIDYRHYISIGLLIVLSGLIAIIRPEIYVRLWNSISTFLKTLGNIFIPLSRTSPIVPATLGDYKFAVVSDFKALLYDFKIVSLALFNPDVAGFYGIDLLSFLNNILRVVIWIPMILVFFMLINAITLRDKPAEEDEESNALIKFKKMEKRFFPIKKWFKDFNEFLNKKKNLIYKTLFLIIIGIGYRVVPIFLDLISLYFNLVKFFDFKIFFDYLSVFIFDFFIVVGYYNKYLLSFLLIVIVLVLRGHFGRKKLMRMQTANEEVAESLAVATLITGPPGSGKTLMATSLALDIELQFRDDAFKIIKKYAQMFPMFPFYSAEEWLLIMIKDRRIVNRSQIKIEVEKRWEEFNLNKDKSLLFNYDTDQYSLLYFDGIKYISIHEALIQYLQAFFLYGSDKALSFTNVALKHQYIREGHFPLYDYDYINKNKRTWSLISKNSSIMNFDSRRILNHVNPYDSSGWYMMDGQVELVTEIDKERGNQLDHKKIDRKETDANQTNDGYNRSIKVTRHEFTIDNQPFSKLLFDTQREQSVNADLRETNEDKITIQTTQKEVDVCLPFFWFDYLLLNPLVDVFNKYYYDFRSKRKDKTLYVYLMNKLINPLFKYLNKIYNVYGYKSVEYVRDKGSSGEHEGLVNIEYYYFILQKMYSDRYATDCYSAYFDNQRASSKKGFLDSPVYSSSRASVAELSLQESYWISEFEEANSVNQDSVKIEYKKDDK